MKKLPEDAQLGKSTAPESKAFNQLPLQLAILSPELFYDTFLFPYLPVLVCIKANALP